MQYYVVILPTTQKIYKSKIQIKQVCVCEMKNYEVQQVIVQVSSGNIFILQNKGFIINEVNNYNEQLFASFQEPKSVRMAIKNHNKKEQQQQQQQQNQQQGIPHGQNQRHNHQQQNAYQNQPNYQNQHQVHNENIEQIFQQKQYQQPQQNFNPQNHNQQLPNPVQQKPVPMNYMGHAKSQQSVQLHQQQILQPFQQPLRLARPGQQFQQPFQFIQQQQYQQPRNQGFPQIPYEQAPVNKITLRSFGIGQEFNQAVTYLLQNFTGCAFLFQGNDIIACGSPDILNEIKIMVAKHYQGTFVISE
ncbi:Hypothetical_protein [Hexamita inflata]|uniref:Hypothetical_protein n=1 Tax=Hexamita inflata TaxID=28002 RepID=A0AA86QWM1_9EUKA|nr:Hypothetical protein HINF_LOCUS49792 [Hexamita inflata]